MRPMSPRHGELRAAASESRDEMLDFAVLMRELERSLAVTASKAALIDPSSQARPVPDEIFRILDQVTNALAACEGITVVPRRMTMTSQQAADLLASAGRPSFVFGSGGDPLREARQTPPGAARRPGCVPRTSL